jgi:hypothetical protein
MTKKDVRIANTRLWAAPKTDRWQEFARQQHLPLPSVPQRRWVVTDGLKSPVAEARRPRSKVARRGSA